MKEEGQKAWKPDCGIETAKAFSALPISAMSEGLEARLKD